MRNMHWREAMKAWTSDSAAKHIAILRADAVDAVNQPIRFQVRMPSLTHSVLLVLKHTICL